MNSATTGANRCWHALPKCSFHFASSCRGSETVPDLFHVDVGSQSSSRIDLTPYCQSKLGRCSSRKRRTCWALTGAVDLCGMEIHWIASAHLYHLLSVLTLRSGARSFIILQESNKCYVNTVCHTEVTNKFMDCFSSNLWLTTHFFVADALRHSCRPPTKWLKGLILLPSLRKIKTDEKHLHFESHL